MTNDTTKDWPVETPGPHLDEVAKILASHGYHPAAIFLRKLRDHLADTPKAAPVRAKDWKALALRFYQLSRHSSTCSMPCTCGLSRLHQDYCDMLADDIAAAENDRTSGRVTDGVALVLQQALLYATTSEHYREPHRNSLLMYAKQYKAEIEAALASENRR